MTNEITVHREILEWAAADDVRSALGRTADPSEVNISVDTIATKRIGEVKEAISTRLVAERDRLRAEFEAEEPRPRESGFGSDEQAYQWGAEMAERRILMNFVRTNLDRLREPVSVSRPGRPPRELSQQIPLMPFSVRFDDVSGLTRREQLEGAMRAALPNETPEGAKPKGNDAIAHAARNLNDATWYNCSFCPAGDIHAVPGAGISFLATDGLQLSLYVTGKLNRGDRFANRIVDFARAATGPLPEAEVARINANLRAIQPEVTS